mmetsp:Transcript_27674/g.64357  ORF Transcript_27674/g.64357 Transcript_27674/m.64357 type:complete len:237 (+) Transcript_27674:229-939(+)
MKTCISTLCAAIPCLYQRRSRQGGPTRKLDSLGFDTLSKLNRPRYGFVCLAREANDKADRALHASSSQQCCSSLQSGELCPLADELEHLGIPGLHPYVNLVASSSSHCVRQPRIHLVCPCVAEPREPELPLHHALTKRLSPPRNGREHVVDKRHLLYAFFLHKPLQLIQHILHSPPSHLLAEQLWACAKPALERTASSRMKRHHGRSHSIWAPVSVHRKIIECGEGEGGKAALRDA